uniref:Uncharacterized protein n=1 Tax=Amblyomma triste TaxID=251400 RepID=A0A023GB72_AMBTT
MLQTTFALIVVFLRLSDALHAASRPYLYAEMKRGLVHMLDLEESGKEYIQMLNKTDGLIDNWNLTGNYEYWTQRHNKTTEYPIYPRASKMTCDDHLSIGPIKNPVMAMYIWQFNNSIRSPFKLSLTVTAPLIPHSGVQRRNVNLNLNGAGRIIISQKNWAKIYTERGLLFSMQKCKFSTTVTFDGWFAYHTKNKTSATNAYHSVGAGNLANTSARLVKTSDHALNYTIDGNYTQVIFFESTFKATLIG